MKIRTLEFAIVAVIVTSCIYTAVHADDSPRLDRGHRLLIKHGFQLVALVDAGLTNHEHWRNSNYTTMMFSDHYASADPEGRRRAKDLASLPEAQWGRLTWRPETSATNLRDIFTTAERPHAKRLTMLQYLDEQLIGKPEIVEDARIVLQDWRKRYPQAIVFTNQVGGVWKLEVLRRYVEQAKPDMLYFDRYVFKGQLPNTEEDAERSRHYRVLQQARKVALAGHAGSDHKPIPYGIYTQNTVIPRNNHIASESETRFQYFTALAFGYKSIAAFTYARDISIDGLEHYMFAGANDPAAANDSSPLPLFGTFAECNKETLNLAPTLIRLLSTEVRVVRGKRSDGTPNDFSGTEVKDWTPTADPIIRSIKATNIGRTNNHQPGDVIVGYFKPLLETADDETYFMLVNGLTGPTASSEDTGQRLTIDFDFKNSGISGIERLNRLTGKIEEVKGWKHLDGSTYQLELTLPGGTGDLFRFKTAKPFIGS